MHTRGRLEDAHRFHQVQKIANIGVWEMNFASGLAIWSEVACAIFGVPPEENVQSQANWISFIHPEDVAFVNDTITRSQKAFTDFSFHYRIVRRDNTVRHIYSEVEYFFDENDTAAGLYGVVHDITDMMNLRYGLANSETNIKLIMDLIPLSIYARDSEGYYLFGNRVFLGHYGITAEELKTRHMRDFVQSQAEYDELWRQDQIVLSSDEKLFISEFRQKNHLGVDTIWRIIKVPFIPEGQTATAMLGIAENITEQKKQESDLLKLASSLSERNRELERFSFMVSHDLRGPLSTLLGIAEVLDYMTMSQEDLVSFIAGIKASIVKLDGITRQLNDILAARQDPALHIRYARQDTGFVNKNKQE